MAAKTNGCAQLLAGLLILGLIGFCICGGFISLVDRVPRGSSAPSTPVVNVTPTLPGSPPPVISTPLTPPKSTASAIATKSDAARAETTTWAGVLMTKRQSLHDRITKLSTSDRRVFDAFRGGRTSVPLTGRSPQVGEVGSVGRVEFLTIADARTAQFSDDDRVLFIRGMNMDSLVPTRAYQPAGLFEVVDVVEFETLIGLRRRGPLLKPVESDKALALITEEAELKEQEERLIPIVMDGVPKAILFRSLTDKNSRALFEIGPGKPVTIDLASIPAEERVVIAKLCNGVTLRVIEPADRALLEAGHIFRPRKWSTADGKFVTDASFVSAGAEKVRLRRLDTNKEVEVPRGKLSQDDLKYLSLKSYQDDRIDPQVKAPPKATPKTTVKKTVKQVPKKK